MRKRGDRGVGLIAVIILAVVAALSVVVSWYVYEDLERGRAVNRRIQDQTKALRDQTTDVENRAKDVMNLVGPKIETKFDDKVVDDAAKFRREKAEVYGISVVQDAKEQIPSAVLTATLSRAVIKAHSLEGKVKYAEHEKTVALAEAASAKARMEDVRKLKEAEVNRLKSKLDDLNKRLADEGAAYANRINSMETQSRQIDDDLAAMERKHADERMRKQNELNKAKLDLEELLKKEAAVRDFTETQGTVVDMDTRREYCFINLGTDNHILPGLKFHVFRKDKGGMKRWKGTIEVKQVFGDYSKASINQIVDPGDPLVHGDFITNPLYGTEKAKRVVVAGKVTTKNTPYEMDELKRRIRLTGAVLEDTVSIFTDYVLKGDEAEEDPNFKTAVNLSVPVMPVQDILPYVAD